MRAFQWERRFWGLVRTNRKGLILTACRLVRPPLLRQNSFKFFNLRAEPDRPSPYGRFERARPGPCTASPAKCSRSPLAAFEESASRGIPTCSGAEDAKKNPPRDIFSASVKCSVLSAVRLMPGNARGCGGGAR